MKKLIPLLMGLLLVSCGGNSLSPEEEKIRAVQAEDQRLLEERQARENWMAAEENFNHLLASLGIEKGYCTEVTYLNYLICFYHPQFQTVAVSCPMEKNRRCKIYNIN